MLQTWSGESPSQLDAPLQQLLIETEWDRESCTLCATLIPRSIVKNNFVWWVQSRPLYVFDAMPENIHQGHGNEEKPEHVVIVERII